MAKRETALHAYKRLVKEFGESNVFILHEYEQIEASELHGRPKKYVHHITKYDTSLIKSRSKPRCILSVTCDPIVR